MLRLNTLFFSLIAVSASVPIEKISNNLIRNGTTYYQYPIHLTKVRTEISTDSVHWQYIGDALLPGTWAAESNQTHSIDINVIDNNNQVRLYYSSRNPQTNQFAIGVAVGEKLRQTMTPQNDPIIGEVHTSYTNPGLIYYQNGSLLLTYVDSQWQVWGVILSKDGLQLASTAQVLLKPSSPPEQILNQWGLEHGKYLYIFYEMGNGGVKVARSMEPLGPYEEMPTPLVVNNKDKSTRTYVQKFLTWGENGWPMV